MTTPTLTLEQIAELEARIRGAVETTNTAQCAVSVAVPHEILSALLASARRLGEVEAERDEMAAKAYADNDELWSDECERARKRADAAEAKLSSLTDRITEIADDALGLQVPGTPLHVMLDSLSKAYHDERIAKSAAEAKLAKHAAASDSVRGIAAMAGDIEHYISAHEDTRHDFMRKMAAAIRTLDAPNWVTPEEYEAALVAAKGAG